MFADEATLIARPHPFSQRPAVVQVKSGRTIQQILDDCRDGYELASTLRVEINGYEVPAELWSRVKPKAGTQIAVTVMPAGGSGGSKWLRLILMVVVMVVAWWAAPLIMGAMGASAATIATYGAAVASGLTMLGMAAVNALVPPPRPRTSGPQEAPERQFAITGTANQVSQYGIIPIVIGEMRYYPTHAALPYTENVGSNQYIRMMLDLGHGDIDVSEIRIGETPIDSYEGVEYEVTRTPTLYSDDVFEDAVGAALNDGDAVVRTSQVQADELGVVINFNGLYGATKKGKIVQADAAVTFEYRLVGSGTWLTAPITAGRKLNWSAGSVRTSNRNPFTVAVSWKVPAPGQYEVRISRGSTNWNGAESTTRSGDASVYALRTIRKTNPSTTGTNKLCIRIKATDQLNGAVQTVNVVQRQSIPVLVGGVWENQFSRNPAWVMHWLVRHCPAVALRAPESMLDMEALVDYAAYCTANELECSMVVDSATTLLELVGDVLSAGMATWAFRDGKISVVWDNPDQQPVGVFTPANSIEFSGQRNFFEMPHGLRVKFTNPDAGFITDEIVVIDDGYSYRGLDARGAASVLPPATRFEQMDLKACRGPQAAWRAARHQMAQAKFRASNYSLETDIEMLRHTRGDLITVMDDVVEWGVGFGRVVKAYTPATAGRNLLPDAYSTFTTAPALLYAVGSGTLDVDIAARVIDGALVHTATSANAGLLFTTIAGTPGYNIVASAGKFIISFYAEAPAGTVPLQVYLYVVGGVAYGGTTVNAGPVRQRYSVVVDTTAAGVVAAHRLRIDNDGGIGAVVKLDGVMVERQVGAVTTPSAYDRGTGYVGRATVVLDEVVQFDPAASYYAQFRCDDGSVPDLPCLPASQETNTITLATMPAAVKVGDIVALGSAVQQTRDLLVTAIAPSQDMRATFKLVDYAPEVFDYIANPPDSIISEATGLTYLDPPDPPRISVILSDQNIAPPSDAGTTAPTVIVGIGGGGVGAYNRQNPGVRNHPILQAGL